MSGKVIRSFVLKTNGTRNNVVLTNPLKLDANKQYCLRLLSFRFSNVFANLIGDIIVSPSNSWTYTYNSVNYTIQQSNFLTPAIGELNVLYSWMKNIIKDQCNCSDDEISIMINSYGKIEFSFGNNFTNINFTGGCLSTNYFGMVNTINSNETTSPRMPIVSDYNSILLSSSLASTACYVQNNDGNLVNTATLVSVNSALSPFELVDFVSVQPIEYNISSSSIITEFSLELRDDNNNELVVLQGANTDFNCWLQIVEK